MRIVGGKDYYDSARAFGEDRDLVFVRKRHTPETLEDLKGISFGWFLRHGRHYSSKPYATCISVIFCGVGYRGVRLTKMTHKGPQYKFSWNENSFRQAARDFCYPIPDGKNPWTNGITDKNIEEFFTPKKFDSKILDILIERKIVIAINDPDIPHPYHDQWYVNTDGLKDFDFAKAVDPYTAYQELSMFVGGVLPRSGNPMVELQGEDIMVKKHGMDKWSFRRMPEKLNKSQ